MKHPMTFDDDRPERDDSDSRGFKSSPPMFQDDRAKPWLFATAGSAFLGATFSAVSTHDFITHLDRQVHSIHCSFIPGAGNLIGESGCRTVMMSPYSSLFRTSMWGGLPISLLAFAVFAYIVYRAVDFALRKEGVTRRDTLFLVLATLLPVVMSIIYGMISSVKLDALCKLCVGVYATSAACLLFALAAHSKTRQARTLDSPMGLYVRWFLEGVAYVAVLAIVYVAFAPSNEKTLAGCGTLVKSDDPNGILIDIAGSSRGAPSIAVLDPLCPACRSFDQRLEASGLLDRLNMRTVLFPLDSSCNWMVKTSIHPGACAVSEAILCDKEHARAILAWAFTNQEELLASAKESDADVRKRLAAEFPKVKGCIGTAAAKNKVNKSLRWAVANALPVLTPQLFIGDKRVCDEDTDLGLEYTITAMLENRVQPKAGR
jgi:uncharacterized membrane protein